MRKGASRTLALRPSNAALSSKTESASRLLDQRIRDLGAWRSETLARMRELVRQTDPDFASINDAVPR